MKTFYAIRSPEGYLADDGAWEDKSTLAQLFNTRDEATAKAKDQHDSAVVEVHINEDYFKESCFFAFGLIATLIFFPWPLKWATVVMIGVTILVRLVLSRRGCQAAFLVLLGYAIFGNLGVSCWWLVLPYFLICSVAAYLHKQTLANIEFQRAKIAAMAESME